MAATWTTPKTWVASEMATAALFNTEIRDNLTWLKTPLESGIIEFATADFTTTSATYVDVTGCTTTITTRGGGLDVFLRINWSGSIGTLQLVVDGVSEAILGGIANANPIGATLYHHIAALSAGSHTIKAQAKVSAGTLTIKGTTSTAGDPLFFVREAGG